MPTSRRTWRGVAVACALLLVTVTVVALTQVGGSGGSTPASPTVTTACVAGESGRVQPLWADTIPDAFGVNVHYGFLSTAYRNGDAVTELVEQLGARHIRDRQLPNQPLQQEQFEALHEAGVGVHVTLGTAEEMPMASAEMDQLLSFVAANPDWYSSVGSVNEPNDTTRGEYTYGPNWAALVAEHQQLIDERMTALGIDSVPRVGPALKDIEVTLKQDLESLRDLGIGEWIDYGDYHRYPMGQGFDDSPTPSNLLDERIAWARDAYGPDMFNTESGYRTTDVVETPETYFPVPRDVQATYSTRTLMENICRGVRRTFIYELLDDPDPSNIDSESNAGLVAVGDDDLNSPENWTKKPAFNELNELVEALDDRGGGYDATTNPYVPDPLRISVDSLAPNLRWVVTGKQDGSYQVILWQDEPIWNRATREHVPVEPTTATIRTKQGKKVVEVGADVVVVEL